MQTYYIEFMGGKYLATEGGNVEVLPFDSTEYGYPNATAVYGANAAYILAEVFIDGGVIS